jgi:hypothetical protein
MRTSQSTLLKKYHKLLESVQARIPLINRPQSTIMGYSSQQWMSTIQHANQPGSYDLLNSVQERQAKFPKAQAAARAVAPATYAPTEPKPGALKRAWLKLIGREQVWKEDDKTADSRGDVQ